MKQPKQIIQQSLSVSVSVCLSVCLCFSLHDTPRALWPIIREGTRACPLSRTSHANGTWREWRRRRSFKTIRTSRRGTGRSSHRWRWWRRYRGRPPGLRDRAPRATWSVRRRGRRARSPTGTRTTWRWRECRPASSSRRSRRSSSSCSRSAGRWAAAGADRRPPGRRRPSAGRSRSAVRSRTVVVVVAVVKTPESMRRWRAGKARRSRAIRRQSCRQTSGKAVRSSTPGLRPVCTAVGEGACREADCLGQLPISCWRLTLQIQKDKLS